MVEKWYVQRAGKIDGPMSRAGLVRWIWSGQIGTDTLVRQEGADQWVTTAAAAGLLDEANAAKNSQGRLRPSNPKADETSLPRSPLSSREATVDARAQASGWHVQLADEESGPLSMDELKRQVAAGQIRPHTQVRQGDDFWVSARSIPGLFDATNPASEPSPQLLAGE